MLHDINPTTGYANHMIAMKDRQIVAQGGPREIVTEQLVEKIFGLKCTIIEDPVAHTPFIIPLWR